MKMVQLKMRIQNNKKKKYTLSNITMLIDK